MTRSNEKLLEANITREVIGAAMEVHRRLGPGYLESVYYQALPHETRERGICFAERGKLEVRVKGQTVGTFRDNCLIEENVVVELKAVRSPSEAEEAQLQNYLRGTGVAVGLLVNFGACSLEWKRRVWTKGLPRPNG
jgi:GxxExxY protein